MAKRKPAKEIPATIIKQMAVLATSGFSLVAALAWNELIKGVIDTYVKPYTVNGSGLVAQLVYAVAITVLVVIITYQLAWIQGKFEKEEEEK